MDVVQNFSHAVIQSGGGGQGPGARGGDIFSHNTIHNIIHNYSGSPPDQRAYISEKLRPAPDAGMMKDKACIKGTRTDTLELLSDWIDGQTGPNVLFLVGGAGTGKSAIANRVGALYQARGRLGSFFSFNRSYQSTRHPASALRTMAYNLAAWDGSFRNALENIVKEKHSIISFESDITSQWDYLLVQPANDTLNNIGPVVLVIDALDESGTRASRQRLLCLLTEDSSHLPSNFRILVTSRPEADVTGALTRHSDRVTQIDLDARKEEAVQDVDVYLRFRFSNAGLQIPRSANADYAKLIKQADGLFQWTFTISEWMLGPNMEGLSWRERYKSLSATITTSNSPLEPLDLLYSTILGQAFPSKNQKIRQRFHSVMGQMLCAAEPLSIEVLATMRYYSLSQENDLDHEDASEEIMLIMKNLGALLRGIAAADIPVQPYHTSFRDFLLDKDRAKEWHISLADGHPLMVYGCFHVMNKDLHFNLCNFPSSFISNNDMLSTSKKSDAISQPLRYACQYWMVHLGETLEDNLHQLIVDWMQEKLLFWFEALSILGLVGKAASALALLAQFFESTSDKQFGKFLQDAQKFIKYFAFPIAESMPHIYVSALPFAAESSLLGRHYRPKYCHTISIEKGGLEDWPAQQALLAGHTYGVTSVAFSPNGKHIISGSKDKMVRIWDAETGQLFGKPLEGHSNSVISVAFSPDGRHIASGSDDGTVRIWNTDSETGQPFLRSLETHSSWATSVAFSPDGRHIASGSDDRTIRIWETETGQPFTDPLRGHSNWVKAVVFSPDGRYLVAGAKDEPIRIWEAQTGHLLGTPLKGYSTSASSVAFSPDGRHIAGSFYNEVRIWDAETGQPFREPLKGPELYPLTSVAFSPNGKYIASGSDDKIIRIWDIETGQLHGKPLEGHLEQVTSVTFSPDGRYIASGSEDKTIRIWDAESDQPSERPLEGHSRWVTSVAFSPDGRYITSGSEDKPVRIWDTHSGQLLQAPLEGHSSSVTSVAFSQDGRHIASGSYDNTVRIWDAKTGQPLLESLKGHLSWIASVAFSPDGQYIASGSHDRTIRIWDVKTRQPVGGPFAGHSNLVSSVTFSPDGRRIASGSYDSTVRIWDAGTGWPLGTPLEGHASPVTSVAFSPDGRYIASGSYDKSVRIWDAKTGQPLVVPLKGHSSSLTSVAFSPDGRHVASGSLDQTIRIWDAETGQSLGKPLEGHLQQVTSVAFSPDGQHIGSGSQDRTIRIWDMAITLDAGPIKTRNLPKNYFFSADVSLKANGWICGPDGELLLWIPPFHHLGLLLPRTTQVIPRQFENVLDFTSVVWGPDWAGCYTPDGRPADMPTSQEEGEEHTINLGDNIEEEADEGSLEEDDEDRSSESGDNDSFKSFESWDEE